MCPSMPLRPLTLQWKASPFSQSLSFNLSEKKLRGGAGLGGREGEVFLRGRPETFQAPARLREGDGDGDLDC